MARDLSRIDPIELVASTPPAISPSLWSIRLVAAAAFLGIGASITGLLARFCVPVFGAGPSFATGAILFPLLAVAYVWRGEKMGRWTLEEGWRWNVDRLRAGILRREGRRASKCLISGLQAPAWVCLKDEIDEEKRRAYRAAHGRNAGEPPADFRFVVATYPKSGNQQVVAFSDGDTAEWYSTAHFIPCGDGKAVVPTREYMSGGEVDATVPVLLAIVEDLSSGPAGIALELLLKRHGGGQEDRFWIAIRALWFWGLGQLAGSAGLRDIYRPDLRSINLVMQLTGAGKVWHRATDEGHAKTIEDRKRMSSSHRPPKVEIGHVSGGNLNIGSQIHGGQISNTYVAGQSQDEIFDALRKILERSDIPWEAQELEGVRTTLEGAVSQRDATSPRLRRAVGRLLLNVSGSVVVGIIGSAAYEALRAIAT